MYASYISGNSEKIAASIYSSASVSSQRKQRKSVEEAKEAQKLGATYLTAGHIYTTDCKKGLPPRGLDFLREICNAVTIPVYAIGGIHAGTGQIREVMECGASGACIMSEMMKI